MGTSSQLGTKVIVAVVVLIAGALVGYATPNQNLKPIATLPVGRLANKLVFSPDGKTLAVVWPESTSNTPFVQLWDVPHNKLIQSYSLSGSTIVTGDNLALSPDLTTIAVTEKGQIRLLNARTLQVLGTLPRLGRNPLIDVITFSPSSQFLAESCRYDPGSPLAHGGYAGSMVVLWNLRSKSVQHILLNQHLKSVYAELEEVPKLWFSADGQRVIGLTQIGHQSGQLSQMWNTHTGHEIGQRLSTRRTTANPRLLLNYSVIPTNDGTIIGLSKTEAKVSEILLWEGLTATCAINLKTNSFSTPEETVITGQHQFIVTLETDRTKHRFVRLWSRANGQLIQTIPIRPHYNGSKEIVAFAPDGNLMAIGEGNDVQLYNTASGKPWGTLSSHSGGVNALAFSPDGSTLASSSWDNTVKLWHIKEKSNGEAIKH